MPAGQVVATSDSTAKAVRVLVVDGRRLIADALGELVRAHAGFEVVGAVTPDAARTAIESGRPDLVLLGAGSRPADTARVLGQMREAGSDAAVVIVADQLEPDLVRLVLEQRLGGLVLSDVGATEIIECLTQVGQGRCVLPAGWQAALDPVAEDPVSSLSARQAEVLSLLAEGCGYVEIAERLGISLNTVKFHMRSIFGRLGVRNRVAAVRRLSVTP